MKPIKYGASFTSNAALAGNAAQQIFSPAANARGAWVWMADFVAYSSATGIIFTSLIAKNSSPTSNIDGDILASTENYTFAGAGVGGGGTLNHPVFIPAGKGLYFISSSAENTTLKSVLYDLL